MDICEHCTKDVKPGQWYLKTDTGVMHTSCAKEEGLIEMAKRIKTPKTEECK